ncbi:tumor necrosis factor ligand superfamily member 14 isoform X1 [Falco biarmicus]|uniref:tumor necrosis factor ligand superfamily member 14 isoform X1 n=1 Tax=Falco biarmicus TaxID=345155 RepID=UPI0024BC26A3|nr:tumor necrosis factor ligand superfamily member 14 isoform X1 [Falco biarmicus]
MGGGCGGSHACASPCVPPCVSPCPLSCPPVSPRGWPRGLPCPRVSPRVFPGVSPHVPVWSWLSPCALVSLSSLASPCSCVSPDPWGCPQVSGDQPLSEKVLQDPPPAKKPAAHLIADATISSQANGSLRWDPTKAWAFLRGLGYQGGSLVCHQPGLYFVYAKVQLGAPACPAPAATLHGIHKRTPRYPGILDLLVNKVVYCPQSRGGPWARHSFLGGLVRLERGDEVFTRVQAPQLVRAVDGSRSYFGMFMV